MPTSEHYWKKNSSVQWARSSNLQTIGSLLYQLSCVRGYEVLDLNLLNIGRGCIMLLLFTQKTWVLLIFVKLYAINYQHVSIKPQSDIYYNRSATSPRPKFITIAEVAEESQLGFAVGRRLVGD